MQVLVTGGAGFVGSHIVDALLTRGHRIAVLDDLSSGWAANLPPHVRLFEIDVRDCEGVRRVFDEVRPQAVFHEAAQLSCRRGEVAEPLKDGQSAESDTSAAIVQMPPTESPPSADG